MKKNALILFTGILSLGFSALAETPATFKLSGPAALDSLSAGPEKPILNPATGGFFAKDARTGAALDFSKGVLKEEGAKTIYEADSGDITLRAEFAAKEGYVAVTGSLKSKASDDRAVILDYRVGFDGKGATFSDAVNRSEDVVIAEAEEEGNAFPLGAIGNAESAVAVAIPPQSPASFGVVGSRDGLAVRLYLGISPVTQAFPNEAPFSFLIYPSKPGWGFRGALSKYYDFFPKYYTHEPSQLGYYMFIVKGVVPENVAQYAFNTLEIQSPDVAKDIARDDKHNILSLLYTLVGQREIKFLDKLPENYDEALNQFANWSVESHKKFPLTKENIVAGGDAWLKQEVENSAVKDPEGKFVILLRNTPWGKNSVSFKVNPSPYLFADKDLDTVGRNSIRLVDGWLKEHPGIDGVLVDSLGANWPAVANYRKDHFAYAKHPLTFDAQGRLFLHNENSHFEWVQYVHDKLKKDKQFLFANGVYAYRTQVPEHFRAVDKKARIKLGRFFISSLLNGATSEAGARATTDRCQDARIMLGRKYYALINYDWEDQAKVEQFFNRSLAYAIFASNTTNYGKGGEYVEGKHEGIRYIDNPNGYYRDKALLDWFLPKAQLLQKAGWQPVTLAEASGSPKLFVERYGDGDEVYFAVFNDSDQKVDAALKVDAKQLGLGKAKFKEIARDSVLDTAEEGTVKFALEPYKTVIVRAKRG